MDSNDQKAIEEYKLKFINFQGLFEELENDIKNYKNGFWATSLLLDETPFIYERSQLKPGKRLVKPPKNKEDKYFHLENENRIIAAFGYIKNWEFPNAYIFVKYEKSETKYYFFNIEKKLYRIQANYNKDGKIIKSIFIQKLRKEEEIMIENYFYDAEKRIIEIKREHKDERRFRDQKYFPENIYISKFSIEYDTSETFPNKILWNANPQNEMKEIWIKNNVERTNGA
jgi:hypothetical protein